MSIMFLSAPDMRPDSLANKSLIVAGSSKRESLFRGGTWQHPLSWLHLSSLQTSQKECLGLPVGITSLGLL